MRQRIAMSMAVIMLLGMMASFGVSGAAEYKAMNQTIPVVVGVYLPMVMQQDLPIPTATFIATVTPTATVSPTVIPTPTREATCHAAYPTVCIPPPPPDLDCKDIPYRRFKVLPPDPHHFDSDQDGIGCES